MDELKQMDQAPSPECGPEAGCPGCGGCPARAAEEAELAQAGQAQPVG